MTPSLALLLALVVFFPIYLKTLCPTVYWDDAGELALAGAVLGVSHPPGQPVHALMGKVLCLLPIGSNGAFRMNLLSALLGTVCVFLTYQVAQRSQQASQEKVVAGWTAALSLGLGTTFWTQCIVTENSTLHLLFCILLWLLLIPAQLEAKETCSVSRYGLFSLIFCVGMANHPALILFLPAFAPWTFRKSLRALLKPHRLVRIFCLAFLGATAYLLLLPLMAARNPDINLGDPSGWDRFLWVMTVQQYKQSAPVGALLNDPWQRFLASLKMLALEEMPPGFLFLVLFGFLRGGSSLWRMRWATVLLLPIFLYLDLNPNFIRPYQLPLYFLLSLWSGIGAVSLLRLVKGRASKAARAMLIAICIGFLWAPFHLFFLNRSSIDRSRDWSAQRLAQSCFRFAERPALFLTGSGHAFHVFLHEICMDGRKSSTAVLSRNVLRRASRLRDRQPGLRKHMEQHWGWVTLPDLEKISIQETIDLNHPNITIYWEGLEFHELSFLTSYETLYPSGLFFLVAKTPWEKRLAHARDREYWTSWWKRVQKEAWLSEMDETGRQFYALLLNARGNFFYHTKGKGRQRSIKEYSRAIHIDPRNSQAFCNLGCLMAEKEKWIAAETFLRKSISLDPSQHRAAMSLAMILLDRQDLKQARDFLRQAALHVTSPRTLGHLGLLEAEAGLTTEAISHLERAMRDMPPGLRDRLLEDPRCPKEILDRWGHSDPAP